MGRNIRLDVRVGGASRREGIYGVIELVPTMMRRDGSILVLPYPDPVGVNKGQALLEDVAPSPDGPEPAWAYVATIRDNRTGRGFSEIVGVPEGTGELNFSELPRFTTTVPPEMSREALQSFYESTHESMERAEVAAAAAEAPTDEMNRNLLEDPESLTAGAVGAAIAGKVQPVATAVSEASDPLAHLNHVEVFMSVIARPIPGYFPQAFSVNEDEGHLYIAFLATISGQRKILIQVWDPAMGTMVSQSEATTSYTNAGTEGLAWFRNELDQLCFIIRGGSGGLEYQVFNFDTGAVGTPVTLLGAHKSAQEGDYFYTCSSGSAPNGVDTVYVYDWASIKAEAPVLVRLIKLDINPYPTKAQSFTVNNGYLLFSHGAHKESAWVSVYNMAGRFVRMFGITSEQMLGLGQLVDPSLGSLVNHESEGAAVWRGQLLTGHALWNDDSTATGPFIVLRHNVPSGRRLSPRAHIPANPWAAVTIEPELVVTEASRPEVTRDGPISTLEGIVSGLPGGTNVRIGTFAKEYGPRRTHRYTCPALGGTGAYTADIVISVGGLITLLGTNHPSAATAPKTVQYQINSTWRSAAK